MFGFWCVVTSCRIKIASRSPLNKSVKSSRPYPRTVPVLTKITCIPSSIDNFDLIVLPNYLMDRKSYFEFTKEFLLEQVLDRRIPMVMINKHQSETSKIRACLIGALESTPSSSSWSTWIFSPFLFFIPAKCCLSEAPFLPSAPT